MRVEEVTVCVHEKRNHPHEYGHYDCSVTFTAQVDQREREGADAAVTRLRELARAHVRAECDAWIAGIARRHELSGLIDRLEYASNIEQLESLMEEFNILADDPESDDENADVMRRADQVYEARKKALADRAAYEKSVAN